jgi:hypothetical protein
MKKEDTPQDLGPLGKITKEVCYVVDDSGNYSTDLSNGWEVKSKALDAAWDDIAARVASARQKVLNQEASPLLYFMEVKLMDIPIVAAYTGFWKWQVKKHLKPAVFKKLSDRKLKKYAEIFEVPVEDLKTMKGHEG